MIRGVHLQYMFVLFSSCSDEILRELPDEVILSRVSREPRLFAELVRRYEEPFVRKARGILRSQEDAEDVVQDVFIRIYQNADRFEVVEGATFRSWAYRILLNVVFTRYQKLKRQHEHTAYMEGEHYETLPDTQWNLREQEELREYLISIFVRLPDTFARVLRLYFLEGYSQREIAEQEGISEGAVKTRMHRAKQAFRTTLENMR